MHGNRGDNRLWAWLTYLMAGLLCPPGAVQAQTTDPDTVLTRYVPHRTDWVVDGGSGYVRYASWTDLAQKLTDRAGEPYHLTLTLANNTPADWQALRRIPPARSLTIDLADSVMSDALLPILATWPALTSLELNPIGLPRSFTVVTKADGKMVYTMPAVWPKRLATSGWELLAVMSVTLGQDIDLNQAIGAIQGLPALEALTINQFSLERNRDAPTALARLHRLKRLDIRGIFGSRWYAAAFAGLTNLDQLTITVDDVPGFNAALPYLTKLTTLTISCSSPDLLRLGRLPALQTLSLQGGGGGFTRSSNRDATYPLDSTLAGLTTLKSLMLERISLVNFPVTLLANKALAILHLPDAGLTGLPDKLDQLVNLEELVLDNNPLHHLPAVVCRLPGCGCSASAAANWIRCPLPSVSLRR